MLSCNIKGTQNKRLYNTETMLMNKLEVYTFIMVSNKYIRLVY